MAQTGRRKTPTTPKTENPFVAKTAAPSGFDWRIWLGLALSAAWLALGIAYISFSVGWSKVPSLDAATLGNFLEGAFAPLAFLWLVIGYFLQRRELEQNTAALRAQAQEIQRTAEHAAIQSQQMAANERHTGQQAYLQLAESVRAQLGSIAGLLFISSQGATGDGTVSQQEISKLFSIMSAQEPEVFSRRLLEIHLQTQDPDKQRNLFYGTEVRARHTNNFIFSFQRLLRRAAEVDRDDMLHDALMASGHGFLYHVMQRHRAAAPPELADAAKTGVHIDSI